MYVLLMVPEIVRTTAPTNRHPLEKLVLTNCASPMRKGNVHNTNLAFVIIQANVNMRAYNTGE